MERVVHVRDQELEKGRKNDSSSSRESSPPPRQRRRLTPTSDDDVQLRPNADDDPLPSTNRPLIRQPLAFSGLGATVANAYEPRPLEDQGTVGPLYLPGQEVRLASTQQPSKRAKNNPRQRVKHFDDDFSEQTGRWRASTYAHSVTSDVPPVYSGQGPYNSLFRAPQSESASRSSTSSTAVASSPTITTGQFRLTEPSSSKPKTSKGSRTAKPRASTTRKKGVKTTSTITRSPTQPVSQTGKLSGSFIAEATNVATSLPSAVDSRIHSRPPDASSSHPTRHSSEASLDSPGYHERSTTMHMSPNRPLSPMDTLPTPEPCNTPSLPNTPMPMGIDVRHNAQPSSQHVQKRANINLTVLIHDIRSGMTDYQLAEIRIPMRGATDPKDGWWADAKDICDKLQSSPSRIDGPARVYTLRGKYRQFFLRVNEKNESECTSANVIVSRQKTVEVVVENIPTPGLRPPPPRIPRDLLERTPSPTADSSGQPSLLRRDPHCLEHRLSEDTFPTVSHRKRHRSPSDNDDNDSSYRGHMPSRLSSSRHNSSLASVQSSPRGLGSEPSGTRQRSVHSHKGSADYGLSSAQPRHQDSDMRKLQRQNCASQASDADEEEVDDAVLQSLRSLLEDDQGWNDFIQLKEQPLRASVALEQCRFVQRMLDQWVGKQAPLRSSRHIIRKRHVLHVLGLDEQTGEDWSETLGLLELYGPEGKRSQSSRVIEILRDASSTERCEQHIHKLFRTLQEVHAEWLRTNLEGEPSGVPLQNMNE